MGLFSREYRFLLWELTRTEFKLRDQGTVLGFLWTLLHPALLFAVLYMLFLKWMGKYVDQYAAYLIVGLIQWQFFEKATAFALTSLRRRSALVRNFKCPHDVIVLSTVGCVLASYLLELLVAAVIVVSLGHFPSLRWFALPGLIAAHLAFTLGVSLWLALAAVEFQDLERIWTILMTAGFFLTPIFYPLAILTERYQKLLDLNPLVHLLSAFRWCLVPDYGFKGAWLAGVFAVGLLLTVGALVVYRRAGHWITERLLRP
ncbi:MAG: hypothetical protein A2X36_04240 [Elusimicrobia bacterium GWA2_69_24]|nr:MAG: hypothetical protein A2X36_04240 [Elusimicrobia bacterium GWA2_69_24]HBL16143.1 hypothetical protein [Elusimicrobiota bacterium]